MEPGRGERAGGVILAAGESRRAGGQKLLLPFGASTVVGRVVGAMEGAGLEPIVVVAGADAEGIGEALRGTGARVVRNPDPSRGMASSLRVGVGALPEGISRFVVALGDQPRLSAVEIERVLGGLRREGKGAVLQGIAIASHRGKRGHPVAFAGSYRAGVLSLRDDQTLRDLIHAHGEDVCEVECGTDAVIRDIDTREEYEAELQRNEAG